MLAPGGMIGFVTVFENCFIRLQSNWKFQNPTGSKSFYIGSRMFPKASNSAKSHALTFSSLACSGLKQSVKRLYSIIMRACIDMAQIYNLQRGLTFEAVEIVGLFLIAMPIFG